MIVNRKKIKILYTIVKNIDEHDLKLLLTPFQRNIDCAQNHSNDLYNRMLVKLECNTKNGENSGSSACKKTIMALIFSIIMH